MARTDKQKVVEVKDPAFKEGIGKNGKPWKMAKVIVASGDLVTVFAPVKIGDEVEMTYNEQYSSWNGVVVRPDHHEEVMKALRTIYKQQDEILKLLKGKSVKPQATQPNDEHINREFEQAADQLFPDEANIPQEYEAPF